MCTGAKQCAAVEGGGGGFVVIYMKYTFMVNVILNAAV